MVSPISRRATRPPPRASFSISQLTPLAQESLALATYGGGYAAIEGQARRAGDKRGRALLRELVAVVDFLKVPHASLRASELAEVMSTFDTLIPVEGGLRKLAQVEESVTPVTTPGLKPGDHRLENVRRLVREAAESVKLPLSEKDFNVFVRSARLLDIQLVASSMSSAKVDKLGRAIAQSFEVNLPHTGQFPSQGFGLSGNGHGFFFPGPGHRVRR